MLGAPCWSVWRPALSNSLATLVLGVHVALFQREGHPHRADQLHVALFKRTTQHGSVYHAGSYRIDQVRLRAPCHVCASLVLPLVFCVVLREGTGTCALACRRGVGTSGLLSSYLRRMSLYAYPGDRDSNQPPSLARLLTMVFHMCMVKKHIYGALQER